MITIPKSSMYEICTYIWLTSMVNIGKYTIHGAYGIDLQCFVPPIHCIKLDCPPKMGTILMTPLKRLGML